MSDADEGDDGTEREPESLTEVLDRMVAADTEADADVDSEADSDSEKDSDSERDTDPDAAGEHRVTLDSVLDAVGRRSFGPLLLVAGLITLAPLVGDIPGVPTIMGILVLLVAGQLLLGQEHLWLPRWMLDRSIQQDKLEKAVDWLRRPARWVDRMSRPRLQMLVKDQGIYVIAIACVVIAVGMPPMELVPFSANGAGAALTVFGVSLISRDGLFALVALLITAATVGLVLYSLL